MKKFIKPLFKSVVVSSLLLTTLHSTAQNNSPLSLEESALDEFEGRVGMINEAIESGGVLQSQQQDINAITVKPGLELSLYEETVFDKYYGYEMFILVDKSISKGPGKHREKGVRAPQTMYIFKRTKDNEIKLIYTTVVSTGKELVPGKSDTREGFTRIQNAQSSYTSRKYGEAMPYSLWFESEYGTAIHQTLQTRCDNLIGQRASAGCIRLCPGTAKEVFDIVTSTAKARDEKAIVLLNKRTGLPIKNNNLNAEQTVRQTEDMILEAPKVVRGYPVFVRIIDANNSKKLEEINGLLENPTENFQKYFKPVSKDIMDEFST